MQHVENDINFIQQEEKNSLQYEGEEDAIVCARFPHLNVCACEIESSIALREINLF